MRKINRLFKQLMFGLFALCLIFLHACISDGEDNTEIENYVVVGDKIPRFEIIEDDGERLNADDFIGKKGIIIFFHTGCSDCKRELPIIEEAWRVLKIDPDCKLVAIARGQTAKETEAYWLDNHFTIPKFHDPQRTVFELFANSYVPRIYLINREGVVQWMRIERFDIAPSELVEMVNSLDKGV